MSIDVSIILISFNKYPQNLLTLHSLQYQTYNLAKMEVILVDDASHDQTYKLKDFHAPFIFRYIRCDQNIGRSKAKNIGIENANGKVIIFLDSEVIVDPNFVKYHLEHHKNRDDIVVAGTQSHYGTYSLLYPNFSRRQIRRFYYIIKNNSYYLNLLRLTRGAHRSNRLKLSNRLRGEKYPIQLLSLEGIKNQEYKQLSFPFPSFPIEILEKYTERLTGYHLAWTYFITRNVSISKKLIEKVGLFNEQFRGWGYEDWELGYRLYKKGVCFTEDQRIVSYHQEHPFSRVKRRNEQRQNFKNLAELHPSIEVCAFSLSLLGKKNLLQINNIIDEYLSLCKKFPDLYNDFKLAFLEILKIAIKMLASEQEVTNLLHAIGLQFNDNKKREVFRDYVLVKELGEYQNLTECFDMLVNL